MGVDVADAHRGHGVQGSFVRGQSVAAVEQAGQHLGVEAVAGGRRGNSTADPDPCPARLAAPACGAAERAADGVRRLRHVPENAPPGSRRGPSRSPKAATRLGQRRCPRHRSRRATPREKTSETRPRAPGTCARASHAGICFSLERPHAAILSIFAGTQRVHTRVASGHTRSVPTNACRPANSALASTCHPYR